MVACHQCCKKPVCTQVEATRIRMVITRGRWNGRVYGNSFPSPGSCDEIGLLMRGSWSYGMFTIVSHFNEKKKKCNRIEDICSQNVSPEDSRRKLPSELPPVICSVSVHPAVLDGLLAVAVTFIPSNLSSAPSTEDSLQWLRFKTQA